MHYTVVEERPRVIHMIVVSTNVDQFLFWLAVY